MALSDELIHACEPFVGKATQKFLDKTCQTMLGQPLESLTLKEVDSLAYWVRMGALKLMPRGKVDELVEAVLKVKMKQQA